MRVHPTILGESFIPDAAKGVLGPQEQVEVAGVSIVPPLLHAPGPICPFQCLPGEPLTLHAHKDTVKRILDAANSMNWM